MDTSYGVFDTTVLKAGPTPSPHHNPCIDSILIKPTSSSNMQLTHAGLMVDRIKCEDMASDISGMFSRAAAAAHLYEKAQMADHAQLRLSAYAGLDFRAGLRSAPIPSCAPAFDVADFIAASNSFNFLASTRISAEPSGNSAMDAASLSTSMNGMGVYMQGHTELERKPSLDCLRRSPFNNMVQDAVKEPHQMSEYRKLRGNFASKSAVPVDFKALMQPQVGHGSHLSPTISNTPGADSPKSPNSPSKQDSALSAEDLDADELKNHSPCKRRKTQQKRVVYVPIGDAKQLKGETPPSDLWAWRKYGQKPIKGSPYPRGYYRCSSSKGCSARKQVERSCSDPTMLIVTYTSEHNHTWPVSKTSNMASPQLTQKMACESRGKREEEDQAVTSSSCEVGNESFFSSIINSASTASEQVVSSLHEEEEESLSLKRDVAFCFLTRTSCDAEEDGVFDDLGELPEMSSIFRKGYLDQDSKHKDERWQFNYV